ncbi:MAG TPA: heavy metal translocating P-type ATPase [Thermoplasmata archaeon]|nr:heavy metal translocating P-type ATPase [Thermoplasmata archaeon]
MARSTVDPAEPPTYETTPLRLGPIARRYPLPFVASTGLLVGLLLTYVIAAPSWGRYVWLGTLVVGGLPLVYQTARRLLRGEFASDVIAMLAIVGALALDQAFAGVIIVLMQSSGEAIDSYAFHRASASLRQLLQRAPRRARRRRGDVVEEIPADAVAVGDCLVVLAGDMLPVDGTVVSAEALLDEAAVTGEPLPRRRVAGEPVLSGTLNVGAPFDVRADRRSQESTYARIVELVRSAQDRKPPLQRLADRYAVWFTPLALAVAALGWLLTHAPQTALAVLVVATPCPLIIATPIAVIGAVNRAAHDGVVVKSGGAIEELGRARVVAFDKTGTLTAGRPEVEAIVAYDTTTSTTEILRWAGSLEQMSSHPLAEATVREARRTTPFLPNPSDVVETGGAGLEGIVEGHRVLVGSESLIRKRLDGWPVAAPAVGIPSRTAGRLVAVVAFDGRPIGEIRYADRLREGVRPMVDRLRSLGVEHVALLTGDNQANAEGMAREAGITEFAGELLPEGKVEKIRDYRARFGTTVMVGDGINDAAALASASVGVAMGARGAGISAESADIVLLVDDIDRVVDGIALSQRMVRVARRGIVLGLGASLVLMAIAAGGFVLPAVGAVLQEVVDGLVILNAMQVR